MKRFRFWLILLIVVLAALALKPFIRSLISPLIGEVANPKTVADRLGEFGDAARARLKPGFDQAQVKYPPAGIKLVAIKADRVMMLYATDAQGSNHWIHSYPILAASGHAGPKLHQGDLQVPEGVYPVDSLNPNSVCHVALHVGYPNDFDRAMAAKEGRTKLGGDIMIHGSAVSIGCLAMGDVTAEDLFVLAADTGLQNITVIITPVDFRTGATVPASAGLPAWCDELYAQIKNELAALPLKESR